MCTHLCVLDPSVLRSSSTAIHVSRATQNVIVSGKEDISCTIRISSYIGTIFTLTFTIPTHYTTSLRSPLFNPSRPKINPCKNDIPTNSNNAVVNSSLYPAHAQNMPFDATGPPLYSGRRSARSGAMRGCHWARKVIAIRLSVSPYVVAGRTSSRKKKCTYPT